jgi:hypothetical protein
MTIIHPVPRHHQLDSQPVIQLKEAVARLFFKPLGDRLAADTKGAFQAPQAGSFMIGPHNLFSSFRWIFDLWVQGAISTTDTTVKFLLTLLRLTILDNVKATATRTFISYGFVNHTHYSTSISRNLTTTKNPCILK